MSADEPFEPKLGRMRAQSPKSPRSFRSNVMRAIQRSGGTFTRTGRSSNFGRGSGVSRVLKGTAAGRRVLVKSRLIRLGGKGREAALAHLRYLQRDGVTREGERGALYSADSDRVNGRDFMEKCVGDRHQFRFIVSPEEGDQYDTLKPLVRKLMQQLEVDLNTRLDWVAVDHYNTGHPHTHIVVRGRDDRGQDLIIAREYLSEGFRARAEALVALDLGPVTEREWRERRQAQVTQERLTPLDRQFVREQAETGQIWAARGSAETQTARTSRLAVLRTMGLAEDLGNGRWRIDHDLEATLRRIGERGDIIKMLHADLKAARREGALSDALIHDEPGAPVSAPVTGRLLRRGLSDELADRQYILVESTDGRVHYIDIGQGERTGPLPSEAIVRIRPRQAELKAADHTIVQVAQQSGGFYDVEAHLKADPSARQSFAETHTRRLEAIRRVTQGVERREDGRFQIGPDYLDKALAYEQHNVRKCPVAVEVLSDIPLADQVGRNGVTWLDRTLAEDGNAQLVDQGFGREAKAALVQRTQWLVEQGLAEPAANGKIRISDGILSTLHRRELADAGASLAKETGLAHAYAGMGERVEGRLRQSVTLGMGKYAMVERAKDFVLVPWRPVLEKHIGKDISGTVQSRGINWTIGRTQGISVE